MNHLNRSTASRPHRRSLLLGLAGASLVLGHSWRASAQSTEADTPSPNVLLLVDSSGSMEFKVDGTFPTCKPGDETVQEKSRWIDLVEVLTGRFQHYSCWRQDRSSAAFRSEFSLAGVPPYDFGYVNPYHRALSSNCLVGPGVLPSPNVFSWPTNAINTYALLPGNIVNRPATDAALAVQAPCAGFAQFDDGLLDVFKNDVRFGLMTFDARVNAGTGYSGITSDYTTGTEGNWSYYLGTPASGHPANCSFEVDQEVGARNAAAPPWEGRMIAFGPPNEADFRQRNAWIQQTLMATRPYGATPLNGQLYDARDFLWNDNSSDPFDSTEKFGPKDDPNWRASDCRKTIMIVLSDGEPNLDLRPYCEATPPPPETAGRCPYKQPPEEVVRDLRLGANPSTLSVETYVIGFALGKVKPSGAGEVSCSDLTDAQCADPDNNNFDKYPDGKAVQACCTLNKIAAAGGDDEHGNPRKAYFANDSTELRTIFTTILGGVIRAATRTAPVFSSSGDSSSQGFRFTARFETKAPPLDPNIPTAQQKSRLYRGDLQRHRLTCRPDLTSKEEAVTLSAGDDFAANVNAHGETRHFYTVIADTNSRNSIRPGVTTSTDGVGLQNGTTVFATTPSELPPQVQPGQQGMDLTDTSCTGYSPSECRDMVLKHLLGVSDPSIPNPRCTAEGCNLFGAILHSTPVIVPGRPSDLLRDESYDAFVLEMAGAQRPTTLFTSTIDGMLHAFNVAPYPGSADAKENEVTDDRNNEFWAFIPPAVLPVLQTQYPDTPATLLDGVPIVKDVVARKVGADMRFERVVADAQTGLGKWRTVLVQAFGEGQIDGGYFALDITNPDNKQDHAPKFLWQLTRDASGRPLFGNGGTPLITTVYLQAGVGVANEVAVAVLPGGDLRPVAGTVTATPSALDVTPSDFESVRTTGPNYTGAERARSLTIVRLDTGEVLRTFRPSVTGFSAAVHTNLNIPSPITGQPMAFPATTGAVADRIFVGDRDGRLWRVDVSSKDPAQWTMKVFFDAFYDNPAAGPQPVILPPVLSTDDEGAVTVAFATGDQQVTAAPATMVNRVVSLTEQLNSSNAFVAKVNWLQSLDQGYRVTGPMHIFNRGLYYAASKPPDASGQTCRRGSAEVFASDYIWSRDSNSTDPLSGPRRATNSNVKAKVTFDPSIQSVASGVIFGLNVQADPTCRNTATAISGDESFGYSSVDMATKVNPGKFYLNYSVSGTGVGDGSTSDDKTTVVNIQGIADVKTQLEPPHVPVSFQSWALIYE
jgi:type IV pilus assembly protein PilY1